jgi:hypothetical protein
MVAARVTAVGRTTSDQAAVCVSVFSPSHPARGRDLATEAKGIINGFVSINQTAFVFLKQ